jgi:predicted permease
MPEGFEFLSPWYGGQAFEIGTPIELSRDESERDSHSYLVVGRLKPDVSWRMAETNIRTIASGLAELYPDSNARTQVWIRPFKLQIVGDIIGILVVLLGAVGLVLLVACANVASMLLARGAGRQTEVAIRTSLGAGRTRIVRQMLTESILLSMLGGTAGVLVAYWSVSSLRGLVPANVHRTAQIAMDGPVLIFALGITLLTGLVFGLAPALTACRTDIMGVLKSGRGGRRTGRARNRRLRFLAIGQIAVALLLTNGAILLFRSQQNLMNQPRGYDTDQVLSVGVWLAGSRYENPDSRVAFWEDLQARVTALPAVERAGVTTKLPMEGGTNSNILVEGEVYDPDVRRPFAERSWVTTGYFGAMGIDLQAGRLVDRADHTTAEWGITVNQAMVDRFWPGESGLGQRIRYDSDPPRWTAVVVGVVEDVRQFGAERRPYPEIYFPFSIRPTLRSMLIVRSDMDLAVLVPAIRREVTEIDPDLPLSDVRTMEDVFRGATSERSFYTLLVDLFAITALLVALAGIYGIMSYQVAQATHESGVRMALGATRGQLLKRTLEQALKLIAVGVAIGLFATINFSFVFTHLAYGLRPLNYLVVLLGAGFVIAVALLASGVPSMRATRVDPVRALRNE